MKKLILPVATLLISMSTSAEEAGVTVYGVYDLTCGKYVDDTATDGAKYDQYSMWVSGYITRANIAKGRPTNTDPAAHDTWLKKYCKENPDEPFIYAAIKLDKELDTHVDQ